MTNQKDPTVRAVVEAIISLWDDLAAFAWAEYQKDGPGLVAIVGNVLHDESVSLAYRPMNQAAAHGMQHFGPDFVAQLDGYRGYDPRTEIVLLLHVPSGKQEMFFFKMMTPSGKRMPAATGTTTPPAA